jgi:hypothetical protein
MKRTLIGLLCIAAVSGGCARLSEEQADTVHRSLVRTEAEPRRFSFVDTSDLGSLKVSGAIADDVRYKIDLVADGKRVLSEVVKDDARAVRVLDGARLSQLYSTNLAGGGWLIDPLGASTFAAAKRGTSTGTVDPIYESLTALRHLDEAIGESPEVRRFNPEASDYRADEDPFPRPSEDSGVARYDLVQPNLPPRRDRLTSAIGSLREDLMGEQYFRRVAVYVKDGRVVEFRERVAPERRLEGLVARLKDAGIEVDDSGTREERERKAFTALSLQLRSCGSRPCDSAP